MEDTDGMDGQLKEHKEKYKMPNPPGLDAGYRWDGVCRRATP